MKFKQKTKTGGELPLEERKKFVFIPHLIQTRGVRWVEKNHREALDLYRKYSGKGYII